MFEIRPVLFANGLLLIVLAFAMTVPLCVDLAHGGGESYPFAAGMVASVFFGGVLSLSGRGLGQFGLRGRQAFLFSASGLALAGIFAAIPFTLTRQPLSVMDALFEAISGITTTGATVMSGLDRMPASLLVWRALLQWLGGAAVITAAVALLPMMKIGGMQLFHTGSSKKAQSLPARLPKMLARLLGAYAGATVVLAGCLAVSGMTPIEAVCHALSSLSTGGFSTSDQSLGHFAAGARWLCLIGMVVGGMNFSLLANPRRGKKYRLLRDSQTRWYLATLLGFALMIGLYNSADRGAPLGSALADGLFQAVSFITTTGFRLNDDPGWGGFAPIAIFVMSFIGGCSGSAAGSVKIFRYEVLFAISRQHVARMIYPHGVFSIIFNRLRLPETVLRSVLSFFMLYFCSFAALATALAMVGVDPLSSLSASAAALGNIGAGAGPLLGHSGGYHALPDIAKALLALGMLLGRLEIVPLLLICLPEFWKD